MKKQTFISTLVIAIGIALAFTATAQNSNHFEKGTLSFGVGIGIGNEYQPAFSNSAIGIKAVVESGLWDVGPGVIALGLQAGNSFSNRGNVDNYKANSAVVAGRAAWHNGWGVNRLDTYAGLSAGAGFNQFKYEKNGTVRQSEIVPVFGGFIGASYFITPSFGFNVEAGYDVTHIQAGFIFKIR